MSQYTATVTLHKIKEKAHDLSRGMNPTTGTPIRSFIPCDSVPQGKHIRRKLELDWGLHYQKATLRRVFYSPSVVESGRWHGL